DRERADDPPSTQLTRRAGRRVDRPVRQAVAVSVNVRRDVQVTSEAPYQNSPCSVAVSSSTISMPGRVRLPASHTVREKLPDIVSVNASPGSAAASTVNDIDTEKRSPSTASSR